MLNYEDAKKLAIKTLASFKVKPTIAKENEFVYVFTTKNDMNIGGPVPLVVDKETGELMSMTDCVMDGHDRNLNERTL